MKSLKKIVLDALATLLSFIFFLLVVGIIAFYLMWQGGIVEKYLPSLYCLMAKRPNQQVIFESDSMVTIVRYSDGCHCDSINYINKKATSDTNAVIQHP